MEAEKKHTIFDFDKLSLSSTTGKARLRFGIYRNNPRVTVYTNEPDDAKNNYGMISAPLDPIAFNTMLELLQDLSNSPSAINVKYRIDNMTLTQADGNAKREMKLVSNLFVGKDEEGVIWISIVADGRPKFKFEFGNFPFHRFYKPDGTQMTKSELSIVAARATVNFMRNVFSTYVTTKYEHIPPNTFKKGNNTGRKASTYEGDDLPY